MADLVVGFLRGQIVSHLEVGGQDRRLCPLRAQKHVICLMTCTTLFVPYDVEREILANRPESVSVNGDRLDTKLAWRHYPRITILVLAG